MFWLRSVTVLSDVAVIFFSSIVVLTPNDNFWVLPLLHWGNDITFYSHILQLLQYDHNFIVIFIDTKCCDVNKWDVLVHQNQTEYHLGWDRPLDNLVQSLERHVTYYTVRNRYIAASYRCGSLYAAIHPCTPALSCPIWPCSQSSPHPTLCCVHQHILGIRKL